MPYLGLVLFVYTNIWWARILPGHPQLWLAKHDTPDHFWIWLLRDIQNIGAALDQDPGLLYCIEDTKIWQTNTCQHVERHIEQLPQMKEAGKAEMDGAFSLMFAVNPVSPLPNSKLTCQNKEPNINQAS